MRPVFDPTGGPDVLVEKMIGTAYETVKRVYCHLPEIRRLDGVLTEIPILAQTSVDNALAVALPPILTQLDEKVQEAGGWVGKAEASAEAAAQSALAATKVNMMFPFTSDVSQMIYDVTVISGQSDVNTAGMALWVGGAIKFDFTILSATTFMLNDATAYPGNTQMRVILNAHFNDLVHGFDQLLGALEQEYKDAAALNGRWCGLHLIPPTTRLDSSPLQEADEYQNRSDKLRYSWNGSTWVALNSSAQQLEERLALSTGSEIISTTQTGAGVVLRLLRAKINERVSILDFGAEEGNPANNVSLAIKKALASRTRVQVVVPAGDWYGGPASAADEDLVVMMTEGKYVVFEEGARVFFGQSGDTYLPFFAGISSSKWGIINPHFVWTGQIRWSETGDLQYAVPDPISPLVSRLGAPHAYQAYIFNTAILALSSHSIYIENMKIESLDPRKPCLQGISTARTNGGAIIVNGIDLNDTNVGILAQGGDVLRVTRIRQGRSNQDIGIPGHAVYSFITNTFIDDVIDTGEESGALRHSGMTVSYKGQGTFQLSNMNSKRAFGPVGWSTAAGKAEKITIDNVIWTDTESVTLEESNVPAIYNAGTPDGNDSTVTFNNVILSTKRDRSLLGGSIKNASGKITLRREDSVATTKPFLFGRFVNCDLDLKLIQRGTFDAKFLRMQSGGATLQANNTLRVAMEGFIAPPVIDYAESNGRWLANKLVFTLSKVKTDGTANPNRSLGSPDAMMPGTNAFTKGQNFIGLTDTTATWDRSFAAGVASLNGDFPISAGTYFVDVMINAATGTWRRLYRYLVSSSRPDGVGSYLNSAQLIGTVSASGASFLSADPVVTVSENFNINVTATVTNATALTLPVTITVATSKIGL